MGGWGNPPHAAAGGGRCKHGCTEGSDVPRAHNGRISPSPHLVFLFFSELRIGADEASSSPSTAARPRTRRRRLHGRVLAARTGRGVRGGLRLSAFDATENGLQTA